MKNTGIEKLSEQVLLMVTIHSRLDMETMGSEVQSVQITMDRDVTSVEVVMVHGCELDDVLMQRLMIVLEISQGSFSVMGNMLYNIWTGMEMRIMI